MAEGASGRSDGIGPIGEAMSNARTHASPLLSHLPSFAYQGTSGQTSASDLVGLPLQPGPEQQAAPRAVGPPLLGQRADLGRGGRLGQAGREADRVAEARLVQRE